MDIDKWSGIAYGLLPSKGAQYAPALHRFVTEMKVAHETHKQAMINELLQIINSYTVTQREINEAAEFIKILLTTSCPVLVDATKLTQEQCDEITKLVADSHKGSEVSSIMSYTPPQLKEKRLWRVAFTQTPDSSITTPVCIIDLESDRNVICQEQRLKWIKELEGDRYVRVSLLSWSPLD